MKSKMKKSVGLNLQPCGGNRSGVGMYTYEIVRRVSETDGLLFCGNFFNFRGRNDMSQFEELKMPLRVNKIIPYKIARVVGTFLPALYSRFFPRTDGSVFFNFTFPKGMPGKIITVVYDMTYVRFPETMHKRNLLRLKMGMKRTAKRSDHIITISQFSKDEIVSLLGVPEEKVSVVHCAASLGTETADYQKVAAAYGIDAPYLLFVGTIEPRKNLVRLIHAFGKLKKEKNIPHKLVLAGGRGWQNEEIYAAAQASAFKNDIIFTGYIADEVKNCLYRNAELLAFPSVYEGFGMPPLEAMTLGCPVVCSVSASLPEVAGEAAEYVDAADEDNIADGLYHVLSDEEYRQSLIQSGLEQAKKFNWENSTKQFIRVCEKVFLEH